MSRVRSGEFAGVRAVTFDLFDTLARFWPPREEIQAQACRVLGIEVTHEGIDRGYALADAYMARENAGGLPVRMRSPEATAAFFAEYERLVLHGAGVEVDRATAWQVWQQVRLIRYDLALFDDVIPSLRRLKALGLALGIISNINRTGRDLLDSLGLEGIVDFAITSREAGAEKPHAPIFLAALRQSGTTAAETVHVGDQYASDIVGAEGAGMRPVLIDRYGTAPPVEGVTRVGSLEELAGLFEG